MRNIILNIIGIMALAFASSKATMYTLSNNLSESLYAPEADSIAIPMFQNHGLLLIVVLLFVIGQFIPSKHLIFFVIKVLLNLGACFISLIGVHSWLIPNHYLIAVSFLSLFTLCCYCTYTIIKNKHLTNKDKSRDSRDIIQLLNEPDLTSSIGNK